MGKLAINRSDFRYAIICALLIEFDAVYLALDEAYSDLPGQHKDDRNTYTLGKIKNCHVVTLCMEKGNNASSHTAADMRLSFPNLELTLVTGVCGGIPTAGPAGELLLGDVVISESILQVDFGRWLEGDNIKMYESARVTGKLDMKYQGFIKNVAARHGREELKKEVATTRQRLQQEAAKSEAQGDRDNFLYPGAKRDRLYNPEYKHRHRGNAKCKCVFEQEQCKKSRELSCDELQCEDRELVPRERLDGIRKLELLDGKEQEAQMRSIIVGKVGSGNSLIMSSRRRDALVKKGIVAVEMEGAGVAHDAQAIIVKAVSDYADGHKSKEWQGFAAIQAASAARELIIRFEKRNQPDEEEEEHANCEALPSPLTVSEWNSSDSTEIGNSADDWHSHLERSRELYASHEFYRAFKMYEAYGKEHMEHIPLEPRQPYPIIFEVVNRMALCLYKYPHWQNDPLFPSDKPRQELEDQELKSLQDAKTLSLTSLRFAGEQKPLVIQARLTQFLITVRMEEKQSPQGRMSLSQRRNLVNKSREFLKPSELSKGMDGLDEYRATMKRIRG